MTRIGFVGAGRMGLPVCRNLVAAGHEVRVADVRPAVVEAVTAFGAVWAGGAAAAVADAELVITMLPGPTEVRELMTGPDALVDRLPPGSVWLDLTSNSPTVVAPVWERALARGVAVLEAPVGGGVPAAEAGTLRLFAGGDPEVFRRCRPVLAAFADPERTVLVGGPGAGYTVKLLVNLLWFGQAVATAEALLLGRRAGVDLGVLRDVLADSAAGSEFVRHDLDALFAGDYLRSFGLDRCYEELASITGLAREHGVPFELSEHVTRIYRDALAHFGPVDGELLAVALLEERAGTRLRP